MTWGKTPATACTAAGGPGLADTGLGLLEVEVAGQCQLHQGIKDGVMEALPPAHQGGGVGGDLAGPGGLGLLQAIVGVRDLGGRGLEIGAHRTAGQGEEAKRGQRQD